MYYSAQYLVMSDACKAASDALQRFDCPLRAVGAALQTLESAELTNAGDGSNLNMDGFVECDASAMGGDGTFGGVAAVSGIKHPGMAAVQLALDGRLRLSHGRVRPMILAGEGAREWARVRGLDAAATREEAVAMHLTAKSQRQHERYRKIVNNADDTERNGGRSNNGKNRLKHQRKKAKTSKQGNNFSAPHDDVVNDTVGCVVVDTRGHVAAGVSSGGIALKFSGRVGEAAAYGAGCWAMDSNHAAGDAASAAVRPSVAVSVTGVGERIMKHLVGRECAVRIVALAKSSSACTPDVGGICCDVLRSTIGSEPPPRDCGVLCVVATPENDKVTVECAAAFQDTSSMAIGWMAVSDDSVNPEQGTCILRHKGGNNPNSASFTFGTRWSMTK